MHIFFHLFIHSSFSFSILHHVFLPIRCYSFSFFIHSFVFRLFIRSPFILHSCLIYLFSIHASVSFIHPSFSPSIHLFAHYSLIRSFSYIFVSFSFITSSSLRPSRSSSSSIASLPHSFFPGVFILLFFLLRLSLPPRDFLKEETIFLLLLFLLIILALSHFQEFLLWTRETKLHSP